MTKLKHTPEPWPEFWNDDDAPDLENQINYARARLCVNACATLERARLSRGLGISAELHTVRDLLAENQRLTDAVNVAQAVATKHRVKHEGLMAENQRLQERFAADHAMLEKVVHERNTLNTENQRLREVIGLAITYLEAGATYTALDRLSSALSAERPK